MEGIKDGSFKAQVEETPKEEKKEETKKEDAKPAEKAKNLAESNKDAAATNDAFLKEFSTES